MAAMDTQEDTELKMCTTMADYFDALYADSDGCQNCGTTVGLRKSRKQGKLCADCASDKTDDKVEIITAPPPSSLHPDHLSVSSATSSPLLLKAPSAPGAPPGHRCANPSCGAVETSRWCPSPLHADERVCGACYTYEHRHHTRRRPSSFARPSTPSRCANPDCRTETSRTWYTSSLHAGDKVCNACYHYERKHHKHRPSSVVHPSRPTHCANVNCRARFVPRSLNPCPRRNTSSLIPGEMVCNACRLYEKRTGRLRPASLASPSVDEKND
ncbi:hypothetical protein C8R46DRAFT_332703 [Mycena filopes]|nr:hypothetical protein C8R46DRAFT_332703 [Mycena filopes]